MKNAIYLAIIGILLSCVLYAQSPQMFNYQAVARNGDGSLLTSQAITILARINKGSISSSPVYVETHAVETNEYGLFSLKIGTGSIAYGVFENIFWGEDSYFLEIEMDENGGTSYEAMGAVQILSVPYALYAAESGDNHWDKSGDDLSYTVGSVGIGTNSPNSKLHVVESVTEGQLASSLYGVYGIHSLTGAYGYLAGSNTGVFGYSYGQNGIWGSTQNGKALYAVVSAGGSGYSGYFDGKAYFSGNVGIGTDSPLAKLEIATNEEVCLLINDLNASNSRPGIKFKNNYIHFISGDDTSDEYFGFYSDFHHTRSYDAKLSVFGKSTSSWGKYIGIKHDGSDGYIDTDAGDIILQPGGGDVRIEGNLITAEKTEYLFVPPADFVARYSVYDVINYGYSIESYQSEAYFVAPVYLPQDATIVSVTAWWKDVSDEPASLAMFSKTPTDSFETYMANMSTSWNSTSVLPTTDNTIVDAVIDNENKFYYLSLILQSSMDFRGVKIEYTH